MSDGDVRSSFFLAMNTGTDCPLADYDADAGELMAIAVSILSNRESMESILTPNTFTTLKSEVEVALIPGGDTRELVCRALVDVDAPKSVKLDKGKLSRLWKGRELAQKWPEMKVSKRVVPAEP